MRNFNEWLSKFRSSIANYGYYIDFDKVYRNVKRSCAKADSRNSDYKRISDLYSKQCPAFQEKR